MDTAALLAAMRRRREFTVPIGELLVPPVPGLSVTMLRPEEADLHRFVGGAVEVQHVIEYAYDWSGMTEDILLGGGAVGASDPEPFDRALWGAWVRDRADVSGAIATRLVDEVSKHLAARAAARKNSGPSSTTAPASGEGKTLAS